MSVSSQILKGKSGAVPVFEALISLQIELTSCGNGAKKSLIELNSGFVSGTRGAQRETPNTHNTHACDQVPLWPNSLLLDCNSWP